MRFVLSYVVPGTYIAKQEPIYGMFYIFVFLSFCAVVSESQYDDVDKVLLLIEAKEFTIEPSTLQSLQQLIQWVADLALSLLARLPRGIKPSGVMS